MRHLPFRQANITMQRIYQSSQLNDKNASRELKNVFFSRFQLYAKAYVHWTLYLCASEKFFKVMNIKKQCWTPHWDRIILIQQFLKEKSLQTMICTCSSIIPLKTVGKIINLKVFLFWLCYKTDGKWLQYPLLSYGYTQKDYCLARIAINYHLCALQP